MSRLAASAREAVTHSRTAGAERLLRALVERELPGDAAPDAGEAWLERVIALTENVPNVTSDAPVCSTATIYGLIVLVPEKE